MLFSYVSFFNIKKKCQSKKFPLDALFVKELQPLLLNYYKDIALS